MDWFNPAARRNLLKQALEKAGTKAELARALKGSRSLIDYWTGPSGPPLSRVPMLLKYINKTKPGSL